MQYPITNTCGHQYTYHLYGPTKDRARKADWLKTVVCPDCKYGRATALTVSRELEAPTVVVTTRTPASRCDCPSGRMGGACTCC